MILEVQSMFIPSPFGMFKDLAKAVECAVTDQEKEGRELGIKKAAEIYAPVLRQLENENALLKMEMQQIESDFSARAGLLRDKAVYFENKKVEVLKQIERLKRKQPDKKEIFEKVMSSSSYSVIQSPIPYGVLSDWLEGKMDKKRKEFFEIEFKNKSKVWKEKIHEEERKIKEITKKLTIRQNETDTAINMIGEKTNEAVSQYEEALEKYNYLKSL